MNNDRLKEIISIIKKDKIITDRSPENLRRTLEDLGPTFIKIGQILSTRVDLLSEEYVRELSKLRNNVLPLSFKVMENILLYSYGNYKDYFKTIDKKPVGSASIAQVYKAVLKDGRKVVLKVKRPGIDEKMKEDFRLLKEASKILHLNSFIKIMDIDSLIDELYKSTLRELDFKLEAKNMIEFNNSNRNVESVYTPKLIYDLCNENVIAMEYVDGIYINNISSLKDKGYDLKQIARNLCSNYIKQALEDGLFHADPHPDNILISNSSIVFLDWGMVGRLTEHNRELLNNCVAAIVVEDYKTVGEILINMSTSNKGINKLNVVDGVSSILNEYASTPLNSIKIDEFFKEMFSLLRDNNLILDYDVTMLVRGICVIESVINDLDSSINLIEVFESKYFNVIDVTKETKKIGKKVYRTANSISNIPIEAEKFLSKVNDKDYKFKFELSDSNKHIDKIENLIHELILGFIDGCLIVGYSNLHNEGTKSIFFLGIIIVSILLLVRMIIDIIHRGY